MAWVLVATDPLPKVTKGMQLKVQVQQVTDEEQVYGLNVVGVVSFGKTDHRRLREHLLSRIQSRMLL